MVGSTVVTGLHGYILVGRWWLRCMLGNLKRRHLVGSTVITGFAATFGEQMMVTVNCQLTVVVTV